MRAVRRGDTGNIHDADCRHALAAFAYAGGPEDQAGAADPSATAQSSTSTPQGTRLAAIVPEGMSAQECVATLHVSQNLSIPFPDLKSKVTGGAKLGAAIHQLKPDANVKAELRKAEEQARSDTRSPQG